jgi:hypothetical protein
MLNGHLKTYVIIVDIKPREADKNTKVKSVIREVNLFTQFFFVFSVMIFHFVLLCFSSVHSV